MQFEVSTGAIIGARESQQDCMACAEQRDDLAVLAVVADGLGGNVGGEIASSLATAAFVDHFQHFTRGPIAKRLEIALAMANQALATRVRADPELDGMGTTMLAVHVGQGGLHWASVGDLLLLLVRDGAVRRLNEDHSMVPVIERMVMSGRLNREQADSPGIFRAEKRLLTCWQSTFQRDRRIVRRHRPLHRSADVLN